LCSRLTKRSLSLSFVLFCQIVCGLYGQESNPINYESISTQEVIQELLSISEDIKYLIEHLNSSDKISTEALSQLTELTNTFTTLERTRQEALVGLKISDEEYQTLLAAYQSLRMRVNQLEKQIKDLNRSKDVMRGGLIATSLTTIILLILLLL